MKKLGLCLLLLIPFILTSCKDDEPQYLGEFRLGSEGESYIKFEPGSYWVYENSITQDIDTITLRRYFSAVRYFQGEENTFHREDIAFQWYGTATYTYEFSTLHPFVDLPKDQLLASLQHFALPIKNKLVSMMYMPPDETGGGGLSGSTTTYVGKYDSLQIQEKYYYDVVEFEVDIDYSQNGRRGVYYWAKNVGLIKRDQFSHINGELESSWELTNYNIKQ